MEGQEAWLPPSLGGESTPMEGREALLLARLESSSARGSRNGQYSSYLVVADGASIYTINGDIPWRRHFTFEGMYELLVGSGAWNLDCLMIMTDMPRYSRLYLIPIGITREGLGYQRVI